MMTLSTLAFGTPTIGVLSNRALPVRTLRYHCSAASEPLDERIERTTHSAAGFATSRIDPRLFAAGATPNFAYVASLTGRALRTASVDAGATVALADLDGRPLWSRDARSTVATWTYDVLGRPLTVQEQRDTDTAPVTCDVFRYGEAELEAQQHNLRGQCVRHYDAAGRLGFTGFSLTAQPFSESRQLLANAEQDAHWAGDDESAWAAQLEATAYTTAWDYDATGTWLNQTDAVGNRLQRSFDVAGRLATSRLILASGTTQPVLSAIDYSAAGQVLSETAGNGIVSAYAYEPETQRLAQLTVSRPAQAGRSAVLQNLHYSYDPVGNVLAVRDDAQPTTYWRNQKVEPEQTYTYDSLYQLIAASGRETASRGQQGQTLPSPVVPLPTDDSVYTNYTRAYGYDRGSNLSQIQHQGATRYTQKIVVSDTSNHAVQQNSSGSLTPADIDDGTWFDPAGNQQNLPPGQPLAWNTRNRLREVGLIPRDGGPDDGEHYQYGSDGMRVRKQTVTFTGTLTRTATAIYLPGLTLRLTRSDDGTKVTVTEALQDIQVADAGRAGLRVLHWESGQPAAIANDQARYSFGNLIGSIGLELDTAADLISREEYYPYGGTAIWTARSQTEADYKFIRYSGKERDATGLYDYGLRYYQPWIGRWLSADPAGTVDGLNLYRMVRNNPASFDDPNGQMPAKSCFGFASKRELAEERDARYASVKEKNLEALKTWEHLPENLRLVHALDLSRNADSILRRGNASRLLSSWNAISTSLIDIADRNTIYSKDPIDKDHSIESDLSAESESTYYSTSKDITFGEIAFVLDFAPSNIIGTFPKDVWFPNHIGSTYSGVKNQAALSESIFFGMSISGKVKLANNTYMDVLSPSELLQQQKELQKPYNEVILIGKPDVSLYSGRPKSSPVSVREILVFPKGNVEWERRPNEDKALPYLTRELKNALDDVTRVNPGVPVRYH